jgi:rubrerythrin
MKKNDPQSLAEYINCLSSLEEGTNALYKSIASKIDLPLVKSLLQEMAIDSQKHSVMLKGVSKSIAQPKGDRKECEKKIGESWKIIDQIQKELAKIPQIDASNLRWLSDKLVVFESMMGEDYYVFVQMKTLEMLMKEINQMYNIDLGDVKSIFMKIINDEEHHRELLARIKRMATKKEEEIDNYAMLKYHDPEAWRGSAPSVS